MNPEEFRNMRHVLRLTQAQLAAALGVTQNTVYRWEAGRNPIPPYLGLTLAGLAVTRVNGAMVTYE